jgi:SSS family transporter
MSIADYLVLCVYLFGVLALGMYLRVRSGTNKDFFLAGRRMGWFPIGLSVMVTVFSAINYVALPNEVFGYGLYVIVALPIFLLAAWPITKIWMPFFDSMQLTSVYEYLERRFDGRVRTLASAIFILWRLFWMATALFASGGILAALINVPGWVIILVGGLVATVYTFAGGMRAVMWTDVCQFFVLFGGIALGVAWAIGDGGWYEVVRIAHEGGRLKPFAPFDPTFVSLDPRIRMTLWSGLIGVFVAFLSRYGADQVVMQRYFSARSLRMAQRGLWLNAGASILSLSLLALLGLAVYAHAVRHGSSMERYWEQLSPMQQRGIAMQQLAAVIRSFPMGATGLVVAGLLAATMSSIDS